MWSGTILIDHDCHLDVTQYENLSLFIVALVYLCINWVDLPSFIQKLFLFVIQKIEVLKPVTLFIIIIYWMNLTINDII